MVLVGSWEQMVQIQHGTQKSLNQLFGVNFARAESSDKREEAKKRIINFVIGFVVTIVLLILLLLFVKFAPSIWGEAKGYVDGITS